MDDMLRTRADNAVFAADARAKRIATLCSQMAALDVADLACEHSLTAERALYDARDLVAHLAMTLNELRALATDAGEFATRMRAEVEARGAAVLGAAGADGDA
jgi:hypothetical protein